MTSETRYRSDVRPWWPRKTVVSRHLVRPLLLVVITWFAVMALYPYTATIQTFNLPQVGEAAKETVIAPFTFDILKSRDDLERERAAATDKVLLVLDYDAGRTREAIASLDGLKRTVTALAARSGEGTGADSVARVLRHELSKVLSESAIRVLVSRPALVGRIIGPIEALLEKGISPVLIVPSRERQRELREHYNATFAECLIYNKNYVTLRKDGAEHTVEVSAVPVREIAFDSLTTRFRKDRHFDGDALNAVYEVLWAYVQPTVIVAEAETQNRIRAAASAVLEISGKVIAETEIVRSHQEVSPEILQKLKSLRAAIDKKENIRERRKVWSGNAGRLLLVLISLLFVAFYVRTWQPRLVKNTRHLAALALIFVVQVGVVRLGLFLLPKLFAGAPEATLLMPEYFIPAFVGTMLVAILFGQEMSFIFTVFTSVFFGVVLGFNQYMFLFVLLCGIVAGLSARNIRYRREYFKIIPSVLVMSLLFIAIWQLIHFRMTLLSLVQNFGLAAINAGVSLFLAMTLTPLFERFCDITTDMTLVELSDMNHPILKRLSIEAAGTYNHSVLAGNLAESAALRIGANALLARVAAYYHDIGKIAKSDYFVENALSNDRNRHVKLSPSMSALIILSHVKDGVELARSYRMPKIICDVIMQHHGTSAVSFFYEKALEQDRHKQVEEKDFRYPGPTPQTRETAIIMLADSVEAASRSLGTSSPKLLRELVKK
ncbi:MAG: HDIG domain-containing protein, partial [Chitinispirillaceae bacterium]|nr:HDIG domain-containing protein [Chitinispirillaceae bacterium]